MTINCTVDSYPQITDVHWKRNSSDFVTILSSGSVGVRGINQTHPSLIIDIVTSSDSGSYVCVVSNIAGTQHSNELTLSVYGGKYYLFFSTNKKIMIYTHILYVQSSTWLEFQYFIFLCIKKGGLSMVLYSFLTSLKKKFKVKNLKILSEDYVIVVPCFSILY